MSEPKNIVVCCDGTGNVYGDHNSNVVKLYATLTIGEKQIGYYHPGVGTMGAPGARNKLEEEWSIILGLAFASGLSDNIGDAYRFLMETYHDGDHIYLFGFSRGAYTARALAGVLHMYGLLYPGNQGLVPYITRMYARTSRELARKHDTFGVARGFKKTFSRDIALHFVGAWDTVSSVGWVYDPVKLPYTARNPIIKTGRHAVSIDERRCFYRDNLWGAPFQPGDARYFFDQPQNIKQVWFAGVHSDIGGSYAEEDSGLSKLTLEWMLREASLAGLLVDSERAAAVLGRLQVPGEKSPYVPPDPAAMVHNSLSGAWWIPEFLPHEYWDKDTNKTKLTIPMGAPRQIVADKTTVIHESVQQRLDAVPDYRPANLPTRRLSDVFLIEPRVDFPAHAGVSAGQQVSRP